MQKVLSFINSLPPSGNLIQIYDLFHIQGFKYVTDIIKDSCQTHVRDLITKTGEISPSKFCADFLFCSHSQAIYLGVLKTI